jgi:SAM-dependent methyltransferase
MSPAEPFPLYFPGDARRPFSSEVATRRFAKVAQLEEGGRVLELGCGPSGPASVVLAQEFGCSVVAADADETLLIHMRDRVRSLGLDGRVDVRRVDLRKPAFREGEFDAILCQGRVFLSLADAVGTFRPLLALNGRLGLTYPVRVGRVTPRAVLDFWERRLGAPLLLPRELLQHLALSGFEPESVESLQDAEPPRATPSPWAAAVSRARSLRPRAIAASPGRQTLTPGGLPPLKQGGSSPRGRGRAEGGQGAQCTAPWKSSSSTASGATLSFTSSR